MFNSLPRFALALTCIATAACDGAPVAGAVQPGTSAPPAEQIAAAGHAIGKIEPAPACKLDPKNLATKDDQLPPKVVTQLARLPQAEKVAEEKAEPRIGPWHEGRPLTVLPTTQGEPEALVVHPKAQQLWRINVATMQPVAKLALPATPGQIAIASAAADAGPALAVWVTLPEANAIARLDLQTALGLADQSSG